MKPGIYNFTIKQGDTFVLKMVYQTKANETATANPVNLTGCQVNAMLRKQQNKDSELYATFTSTITSATEGKYEISLTAAQTALLDFSVGYYDIQLTLSDGTKQTLVQGKATLDKEVTNV